MNLKIDKSRGMEFHMVASHKETSKKTDAKLFLHICPILYGFTDSSYLM